MNTCTLLQTHPNTPTGVALYQEQLTRVYHFLYIQLKNQEVAEELTSQVFLKAVPHLSGHRTCQHMERLLLRIAHTIVLDYWHSVERMPANPLDALLEAGWESPEGDALPTVHHNSAEQVRRILQQLPQRYKEVLTYRFLLKLTVSEVAELMEVTESTVKKLQFDALKRAAALEAALIDGD